MDIVYVSGKKGGTGRITNGSVFRTSIDDLDDRIAYPQGPSMVKLMSRDEVDHREYSDHSGPS